MKLLRVIIMTVLVVGSLGRSVPFWMGLFFFYKWIVLDVEPFVKGINTPGNSFPFASIALRFMGYTACRLTIVVLFWGVVLCRIIVWRYIMTKPEQLRGFPIVSRDA